MQISVPVQSVTGKAGLSITPSATEMDVECSRAVIIITLIRNVNISVGLKIIKLFGKNKQYFLTVCLYSAYRKSTYHAKTLSFVILHPGK